MPTRKALFCDAAWDSVTCPIYDSRLANYTARLFVIPRDVEEIRLSRESATSQKVVEKIPEAPVLFSGSGHGAADSFNGYHDDMIFVAPTSGIGIANPIAKGAVVHLFACLCGFPGSAYLAHHLVKTVKAKAFIGYDFPLNTGAFSPADLTAAMLPDCLIDQWVLEGVPAAEILARVNKLVPRQREQLGTQEFEDFAAYDLIYQHLVGPWDTSGQYGTL